MAPRRVDRRDLLWEVQIHAILRINVATPPLKPQDIDAFFSAFLLCSNSYAPPLGQLALKSDREFSEGWPANPWEVTEPSTG